MVLFFPQNNLLFLYLYCKYMEQISLNSVKCFFLQLREYYDRETLDDVRKSFDNAERSRPGITDEFNTELISSLVGSILSFENVKTAIEKLKG